MYLQHPVKQGKDLVAESTAQFCQEGGNLTEKTS
jgi:hypothetical protein